MPTQLRSLFEKPIDRHIEGVIKADDESDLLSEVSEYVVTKEIAKRLDELLGAYLTGGAANGVWIAGFFGSGKSHLLKILSLILENRLLGSTRVADLFLPKLDGDDKLLKADLEKAIKIPSQSVRFNIDQKADLIAKDQTDALLAVFVKVFNELRGYYPKQGYIAEVEADLDGRKLLSVFKDNYHAESGRAWEADRDVVHTLENETFARAYAKATGMAYAEALQVLDRKQSAYKVSIESFADSVKTWLERQPPNFRLNFFVDEVGQFVGTNSKLMLNLQTVAETLATKCQGRAWLFVTSQGDLATVLGDLGTSANDFTKIQGRFKTILNLTSQDVAEVICRRLLAKDPAKPAELTKLYTAEKSNLKTLFQFSEGSRSYVGFKSDEDFCNFYPFHPYQFELLQASLIALSKHNFFTGRQRSIGERSMLGILQDVVKSIASEPIGRLATFDRMFEGIRNALRADLQNAIQTAERNLGGANTLSVRLLKALFLLKFVKEFKPTPRNLAILLIDRCDLDIAAHEAAVRTALNQLENDTYIQRNGDIYEFLTDDEKDVETEIKDTDVDETDIAELLGQIVFDDIIVDSKLRFEDNKQDYPFTRRLDGQVFHKREYELSIHIASPMHESYDRPTDLVNQSMGKAELLVILPPDKLIFDDLKLHRQTAKYFDQNYSPTMPEIRSRILKDKQQKNSDRLASLHDRLKESVCKARLVLNGSDLTHNSNDARTRFAKAFQDLVRFAYPSLRMLRKQFNESDLRQILTTSADDLFKSDDGTLSEAEQEILLKLKFNREQGTRISVADLSGMFEKRQYGWPQTATLCLLARLFMRGKVELRSGGNLLNSSEALEALSSNRNYGSTIITLQEQFDVAAVANLKKFHQDFFNAANPATEAKDVATEFQKKIRTEAAELEKLASHATAYPFLSALTPIANDLTTLADREWSHCLKNLKDFSEKLLDAKESSIDPLKSFYNGPKRAIYDDITAFLHDEEPNFADVAGTEATELRDALASTTLYKGNALQQAKAKLDSLRGKVAKVVTQVRADATSRVEQSSASVQAAPDFSSLTADEKSGVLQPFTDAVGKIQKERLTPVIRQIADRAAQEILPCQLQKVAAIADAKKPMELKDSAPVQYVSARLIPIVYNKAILETEADLDAYLAALKNAYAEELKKKRRITL